MDDFIPRVLIHTRHKSPWVIKSYCLSMRRKINYMLSISRSNLLKLTQFNRRDGYVIFTDVYKDKIISETSLQISSPDISKEFLT